MSEAPYDDGYGRPVRRFRLDHPLDVRATLGVSAHPGDPSVRRAGDGVWRATRTPCGPATVHIDDRLAHPYDAGGVVTVHAWGQGADWALAHAGELLGLHDDVSTFSPNHPTIAEVHRRRPGLRMCRTNAITEALVPTIVFQKVQTAAAQRSWRGIVRRYSEPAPGPVSLMLPPDPRRLAALPYDAFHRFNVERRRADTIRRVCARHREIERLAPLGSVEVQRRLQSLPGIGPWTAGSVAQLALGDADAVVVGDFHLPHMVSWVLAREPRATDDRMLELLAPYAGHRGRVQRLLKYSGQAAPRYGPRLSIMQFADR